MKSSNRNPHRYLSRTGLADLKRPLILEGTHYCWKLFSDNNISTHVGSFSSLASPNSLFRYLLSSMPKVYVIFPRKWQTRTNQWIFFPKRCFCVAFMTSLPFFFVFFILLFQNWLAFQLFLRIQIDSKIRVFIFQEFLYMLKSWLRLITRGICWKKLLQEFELKIS